MSVSSNKAKDLIAMENDKKTLKELNDTIKAIKKRKSIKTSPGEIYDEIEILLGTGYTGDSVDYTETLDEEDTGLDDQNTVNVVDSLDDFTIEPKEEDYEIPQVEVESIEPEELPDVDIEPEISLEPETIEELPIEEPKEETADETFDSILDSIDTIDMGNDESFNLDEMQPIDEITPESLEVTEEQPQEEIVSEELPVVDTEQMEEFNVVDINNEERLKVIDVEPLESSTESSEEKTEEIPMQNDEFLIGEYNPEG